MHFKAIFPFALQKIYVNEAQIIRQAAGTEDITIYLIDTVPNFKQFENVPPNAKDLLKDLQKLFGVGVNILNDLWESKRFPKWVTLP